MVTGREIERAELAAQRAPTTTCGSRLGAVGRQRFIALSDLLGCAQLVSVEPDLASLGRGVLSERQP